LKLLPPDPMAGPKHRGRFEREARAAARLHHTNIIPVFGVGEHEGSPYYVMQLIEGRGLDAVIRELRHEAESSPLHGAGDVARSPRDGGYEPAGRYGTPDPGAGIDTGSTELPDSSDDGATVCLAPDRPPMPVRLAIAGVLASTPPSSFP